MPNLTRAQVYERLEELRDIVDDLRREKARGWDHSTERAKLEGESERYRRAVGEAILLINRGEIFEAEQRLRDACEPGQVIEVEGDLLR
jgi:hypothetical protein